MRKTLVGIIAAVIIIGTGAYFGTELWAQFRTKNQVEAVFDSLRATFPVASHGRIELYSKQRGVKISDVILQSGDGATTIKFGQIFAVGTRGPSGGRVAAARIEITNWEFATTLPMPGKPQLSYKAPTIVMENFSGPVALNQKIGAASMIEALRASLEYVAGSTADSITAPKLTATLTGLTSGTAPAPALGPLEYTYSDIAIRDIRDRRIGSMTTERITITSEKAAPDLGAFAGAMAKLSFTEINIGTMLTLFDQTQPKADTYLQMYKQASIGPIEFRFSTGPAFQLEGSTIEDIGVRPSKLSMAAFLAIADSAPKTGTPPSPEQLRSMMDQLANIYEGIHIGKFELRGMKTAMQPNVSFSMAAMRMTGFENGRIAEFAFEGMDGMSPQKDPIHIGRFALKGVHMADLLRRTSELAQTGPATPTDKLIGLSALLEGLEIKDVDARPAGNPEPVHIDTFSMNWGQFIGAIPSMIRLTAKTSVPAGLADPGLGGMLAEAGLPVITTTLDLGSGWDESSQTLTVSPAAVEIDKAFAFSAKIAVNNVTRVMFSGDPVLTMAAADQTEIGPIEFSLRDTGGLTIGLAHYAKIKGLTPEDAKKQIIDSVNETAKSSPQPNADVDAVAQAIVQFIDTPGSTLTIKVTPKDKVKFKQLFGLTGADPGAVANLFTVEAKTTK
ncbi:MAG TPA: hypothetical protein VMH84_19170 [Xanthobacteraceae bacterium]|nr:hypothetical protein [Xanthobacteraceae bacterium]